MLLGLDGIVEEIIEVDVGLPLHLASDAVLKAFQELSHHNLFGLARPELVLESLKLLKVLLYGPSTLRQLAKTF